MNYIVNGAHRLYWRDNSTNYETMKAKFLEAYETDIPKTTWGAIKKLNKK
ncbi:MAG: hypothetical protein JXA60_02060 [Candidatus Coatesbacteria bacterium]|nr:hypothetical protein [Candidatus Coatesbacteria bacterium]